MICYWARYLGKCEFFRYKIIATAATYPAPFEPHGCRELYEYEVRRCTARLPCRTEATFQVLQDSVTRPP